MTVVSTKPVPVTETAAGADPLVKLAGTNWAIVGAGLSTSRFTAVPEALVAVSFSAITGSNAPVMSWAAGTAAVTLVLLTTVVTSTASPTWTAVVLSKPVPVTVSVVL